MKVAVLGATGGTSRAIAAEARRQGYAVTALVRSEAKAADLADATLVTGAHLVPLGRPRQLADALIAFDN